MKNELYRIVYCSRNRIRGDEETTAREVHGILEKARANNQRAGVTGALLYNSGSFAQVLEGPLGAIERIFETIQRDARHSDVTVVQIGPIEERQFPAWSMAFAGSTAARDSFATSVAFNAVFSRASDGEERILAILQDLVLSDSDWALLEAA